MGTIYNVFHTAGEKSHQKVDAFIYLSSSLSTRLDYINSLDVCRKPIRRPRTIIVSLLNEENHEDENKTHYHLISFPLTNTPCFGNPEVMQSQHAMPYFFNTSCLFKKSHALSPHCILSSLYFPPTKL